MLLSDRVKNIILGVKEKALGTEEKPSVLSFLPGEIGKTLTSIPKKATSFIQDDSLKDIFNTQKGKLSDWASQKKSEFSEMVNPEGWSAKELAYKAPIEGAKKGFEKIREVEQKAGEYEVPFLSKESTARYLPGQLGKTAGEFLLPQNAMEAGMFAIPVGAIMKPLTKIPLVKKALAKGGKTLLKKGSEIIPEKELNLAQSELRVKMFNIADDIVNKKMPADQGLKELKILDNKLTKTGTEKVFNVKKPVTQYKSAEEFIKAEKTPVYHGTDGNFEKLDITKTKEGIFLTPNIAEAKLYGKNINKLFIDKNAKIKEMSITDAWKKTSEEWKNEGWDAIRIKAKKGEATGSTFASKDTDYIQAFNPDIIKTKSQLTDIYNQANKGISKTEQPVFKGLKGLSLKTVEKLKGKTVVSKQYIDDLAKAPDLKQPERDMIREVLKEMPEGKINVKEFADKVDVGLLKLNSSNTVKFKSRIGGIGGEQGEQMRRAFNKEAGDFRTQYESISLPPELRGNIDNYYERIYESPIKTSAGNIHFSDTEVPNYFGHIRIEDMADNKTRRVIELQSDLYQKGALAKEIKIRQPLEDAVEQFNDFLSKKYEFKGYPAEWIDFRNTRMTVIEKRSLNLLSESRVSKTAFNKAIKENPELKIALDIRDTELQKLSQYNDPTAHFRIAKEEVKLAAKDGKTKLQFPTGETAMNVEGLAETKQWFKAGTLEVMTPEKLKIGEVVSIQRPAFANEGTHWAITDVVGDGKFKAVPKNKLEMSLSTRLNSQLRQEGFETLGDLPKARREKFIKDQVEGYKETFDISGKMDTSNPIYRFYEKTLGKYLIKKYNAKEIVDPQGVSWFEIDIKPEMKKSPIEAFGGVPFLQASRQNQQDNNQDNKKSYKFKTLFKK